MKDEDLGGGTVFVSGDANVAPGLGPVEPHDNDVFLMNALEGGSNVKFLSSSSFGLYVTVFGNFYTGQGATVSTFSGAVTDAQLAGVDLFFAILPDDAFVAAEITALQNFLIGGGTVFFVGDSGGPEVTNGINSINGALMALGSTMSIVRDTFNSGVVAAQVASDPYTAGVNTFYQGVSSQVAGGTVLFRGQPFVANVPFLAYERIGDVPEPSTLVWMLGGLGICGVMRRVRRS
ncbi:MAG: PEP-CTERM sorting domain-containing protein [Acidobacteria bacterium]|nr:PEP-CTERM sorting domain-containing protein [Acidobacteriota bacterium]